MRKTIIINGALNAKIVGQTRAQDRRAGRRDGARERPRSSSARWRASSSARNSPTRSSPPCWPCTRPRTFDDAMDKAERLIADGGYGHTSSVYLNAVTEREKLDELRRAHEDLPYSGQHPLLSGRHRRSVQLQAGALPDAGLRLLGRQLRLARTLASSICSTSRPSPRGERTCCGSARLKRCIIKKGCLPVALDELETVMGKKKAFIVTDTFLYQQRLHQAHYRQAGRDGHRRTPPSSTSRPIPPWPAPRRAPQQMTRLPARLHHRRRRRLAPWTPAKIMWVLYEHPEADFMDMAMRFMRYPQARLHLPQDGRKGLLHRHPHLRRYRLGGHPLRRHHRREDRRQVPAGRL